MAQRRPPVPPAVQAARLVLAVVAATHVAVPLVLLAESTTGGVLVRAVALHAPLLVVVLVLVGALPTGSRWARRPATVAMALSTAFSAVLRSSALTVPVLAVVADMAQVAVLVLLWAPASSRGFFPGGCDGGPPHRAAGRSDAPS